MKLKYIKKCIEYLKDIEEEINDKKNRAKLLFIHDILILETHVNKTKWATRRINQSS